MTPGVRNRICGEISSLIRKNKKFFLSGHSKPDGDTVASELAMASLLKRLNKSASVYNAEPVPSNLLFLPGVEKIKTAAKVSGKYDVAIIFECSDADRMGNIIDLEKQAKTVINIDHHLMHAYFGDVNLINPHASSNSEQLYYIFQKMHMPLTKEEAAYLYVGIMTDTGRFQHSNTNAETLKIASKLLERGVDASLLCERIYGTTKFSSLKLISRALSNLAVTPDGKIAYSYIRRRDFEKSKAVEEESEEIVNYGLQIPSALMSILFRESISNGKVKISFRSRRDVNVCKLAEEFGGGGHKYASGCRIEGDMKKISAKVMKSAKLLLRDTVAAIKV